MDQLKLAFSVVDINTNKINFMFDQSFKELHVAPEQQVADNVTLSTVN